MLTLRANYSGKSARHETAETAKPWVDTFFVGKVPLFLRGSYLATLVDALEILGYRFGFM